MQYSDADEDEGVVSGVAAGTTHTASIRNPPRTCSLVCNQPARRNISLLLLLLSSRFRRITVRICVQIVSQLIAVLSPISNQSFYNRLSLFPHHQRGGIKRLSHVCVMSFARSFVRSFVLCGQGSSLLWTPALRPFESVQCASPERVGELIDACGVRAM